MRAEGHEQALRKLLTTPLRDGEEQWERDGSIEYRRDCLRHTTTEMYAARVEREARDGCAA